MNAKKILILSPSKLPIPAVDGGAIELLIEGFIKANEKVKNPINIDIISHYNEKAIINSGFFQFSKFYYIRVNLKYKLLILFKRIFKKIFKYNLISPEINLMRRLTKTNEYECIIVEGNIEQLILIVQKDLIKTGTRLYFHVHADIFSHNQMITELNQCTKIIAVSNYIKNRIIETCVISEEKIAVLYNAVEIAKYNQSLNRVYIDLIKQKYSISPDEKVVIFIGRIVKEKGIYELLFAFKKLLKLINCRLLLVGSFGSGFGVYSNSELEEEFKRIAGNLTDKIITTGYISNSEIFNLLKISDVAVVPTTIYEEAGGPMVSIEAMASGLPLIVSDSGGIVEYVDESCSIIVKRDYKFINNLTLALASILNDNTLSKKYSLNSKIMAKKYDVSNYYDMFFKIMDINI